LTISNSELDAERETALAVFDIAELDRAFETLGDFVDEIKPQALAMMLAHPARGKSELIDLVLFVFLDSRTSIVNPELDLAAALRQRSDYDALFAASRTARC
jgi:hypothetical protein